MRSIAVAVVVGTMLSLGSARVALSQSGEAAPSLAPRGEQTPSGDLSYTTYVDRTAVWVGDVFNYRIFVEYPPTIEFILENINRDTIALEPLRVLDVTTSTATLQNGNQRLVVDLQVTHFTTEDQLQIPQLTLFYFRRDGASTVTSEGAAAESVTIPGPVISVRSALPPGDSDIRDAVTVSTWPRGRWIVAGIGWTALVVLLAGLAWEGVVLVRRRGRRQGPDPRKAMAAIRERWSQGVPSDFGRAETIVEFYGRSYHDVKEFLGYVLDARTEGLLADEIRDELARTPSGLAISDQAGKVLAICESARYSKSATTLTADTAQAVADDVRQIFQAGARM